MRPGRILILFWIAVLFLPTCIAGASQVPLAETESAPATQPAHADGADHGIMALVQGSRQVSLKDIFTLSFWIDTIRELAGLLIALIPRVLAALVFLAIFWLLHRAVRRVALASMDRARLDTSVRDMFASLLKWTIVGFGLVIALNQLGIQVTALLAGVSIIGIAVGFAAQETLANFIAGAVIFWDKPFRVGDLIEVHNETARVTRISFRSTRLLNADGQLIVLPNTLIVSGKIMNHSAHPLARVNVPIAIRYGESIDHARQVLLATFDGDGRVLADPAPVVGVTECADSAVKLMVRFWVNDIALWRPIHSEYLEKARKALDAAGIGPPYPQRQVVLTESPAEK